MMRQWSMEDPTELEALERIGVKGAWLKLEISSGVRPIFMLIRGV